jgi:predicted metal-dependent phosphoesterase TrpH
MLKLDLHVHTERSRDGFTHLKELPSICRASGIDGVAITDHNCLCDDLPDGIIGIPGIEISSSDGHVVGLGLWSSVPKGLSADETINKIHRLGGIAIVPHPYDPFRSSVNPELLKSRPDAVEVVNASSLLHSIYWKKAQRFVIANGFPSVGGSDSHIPQTVGIAYTVVESESDTPDSILAAIRAGSVRPEGRTVGLGNRFRKMLLHAMKSR